MIINDRIIDIASKYVGKKELKGNSGFKDKRFEDQMLGVGWEHGWAWCAVFTELIWTLAYQQENSVIAESLEKIFSPSATKTYKNFAKEKKWKVSKTPVKGAIVIWQNYRDDKPHWSGHAGLVESLSTNNEGKVMFTIEGNSNSSGGREGIEVARLARPIDFTKKKNGLVLKGFILPLEA